MRDRITIDEGLLIPPENRKLCFELTGMFCIMTFCCSSFMIIYFGIVNEEFNNVTAIM